MPRLEKAMKDVVACDKPRGAGKQALIRGFPNGETRPCEARSLRFISEGEPAEVKHLSKRRKRKQVPPSGIIPLVVASERGTA